MERLRSIGAATLLAGLIVLVFAPWLGVWAILSSRIVWWTPLVVGFLVCISGGTMLFLTWAHDRGEAKAKAETIDEFTLARIRNVWAEEEGKLRRQLEKEALQEFKRKRNGGNGGEDGEGPAGR